MEGWKVSKALYIVLMTAGLLALLAVGTVVGEDQEHGPYFGEDSTPNQATTGDPFTFTVVCEGCIPKMTVKVIYRYEDGEYVEAYMKPVKGAFQWSTTITASETPGTMYYYFGGFDSTGGWVYTEERAILVIDNDPPVLISDDSERYAQPGRTYDFDFLITDNGDIASAWVDYRFEDIRRQGGLSPVPRRNGKGQVRHVDRCTS
jgi:hypothetical protein